MPTARVGLGTGVVNGKIYAFGGALSYYSFDLALSEVEIYDPVMDRWETGPAIPTARAWLSSSAVNAKIYAIGGQIPARGNLSVVEEYAPGSITVVQPRGKLPTEWGKVKQ